MGLSSSKSKTTSDQNTTQTGTTMPITPDWVTNGLQDYVGRIGAYGDMDPNQFIAGASPLQQQSWANASQLGGWRPQAATAAGLALQAGTSGANLAGSPGMVAHDINGPEPYSPQPGKFDINTINQGAGGGGYQPQPSMFEYVNNPGTPRYVSSKANPQASPQIAQGEATQGAPGLVTGQGYSAAPSIPGYGMPRPGQPIGYTPPAATQPNPALTGAGQMGAYQNPWDQQVVDTTLANYDQQAGIDRARMEAAGAGSGAFGGSRWGVQEGTYDAASALNRAQTEAQLRQTGFNTAAGYGMQDAAAGNQMMMFNAGQQDNAANRALAAAGLLGQQASQYGADTRADLGAMSALGEQQRGIEQAYAASPLAQLQMIGQLYGATPYQVLTGQQVDTTGTAHGTSTTSQSPSLFNSLLQGASAAAMFL